MAQSHNDCDSTVIFVLVAVVFGGILAVMYLIGLGIAAYTAPYSPLVFFVPFVGLSGVGYGAAYVLDHDRKRRLVVAAVAATGGTVVFLVALYIWASDAPVLWNAGALLSALGFFLVFAALPTAGICFGVAVACPDLRSALLGETLVDLSLMPEEVIDPVRPYLDGFLHHPPWRRFSLPWLSGRHPGTCFRITHDELRGLFGQACELLADHERLTNQAIAAMTTESAADSARARDHFLASLPDAERGILEVQLRANAEVRARVDHLTKENARLSRALTKARKEHNDLDTKLKGWAMIVRTNLNRPGKETAVIDVLLGAAEQILAIEARSN